ncbi:unnamed protein product [Trichogramma brassicae]|uniref:Uncharacterized protein n=1 Tax=Trichogramma brassicae TaxID=86971 RepID=A0A6H5J3U9_9HYME|nr:unnamed protein product [Trichogramma brassicae]
MAEQKRVGNSQHGQQQQQQQQQQQHQHLLQQQQQNYIGKMMELMDDLCGYMARDEAKINKFAAPQINKRVHGMQALIQDLATENSVLKARLEESQRVEQQLWQVVRARDVVGQVRSDQGLAEHASGQDAVHTGERNGVDREDWSAGRVGKKSYAVVVSDKKEKETKKVEEKLRTLGTGLGLKVESFRGTRGGKVILGQMEEAPYGVSNADWALNSTAGSGSPHGYKTQWPRHWERTRGGSGCHPTSLGVVDGLGERAVGVTALSSSGSVICPRRVSCCLNSGAGLHSR